METQIYWLAADPLLKLGIMARHAAEIGLRTKSNLSANRE